MFDLTLPPAVEITLAWVVLACGLGLLFGLFLFLTFTDWKD